MVQDVSKDLNHFFKGALEDISKEVRKDILTDMSEIMYDKGFDIEKRIFRYIADRVIGHVNPPKVIEGEPAYEGVAWKPLSPDYARKKKPWLKNKKFINKGWLKNYLAGRSAAYFYGKPKTRIDLDDDIVYYESMFSNERKPFTAVDPRGVPMELKLENKKVYDGDNDDRPIVEPMQDYLFFKFENLVDKLIDDYMEKNYGV